MVIGVLASGILAGLFGVIAALITGFPLWSAILLYPILGTVAACGFIAVAATRHEDTVRGEAREFSTEMR